MRRRDFVAGVAGATAAWPLTARAQQGTRTRSIGVLTPLAATEPVFKTRFEAFQRELERLGWFQGSISISIIVSARDKAIDIQLWRKSWSRHSPMRSSRILRRWSPCCIGQRMGFR